MMKYLVILSLFFAHASFAQELTQGVLVPSQTEQRLKKVEKNIVSLEKALSNPSLTEGGDAAAMARVNTLTYNQLEELRTETRALRGEIEQLQLNYNKLDQKISQIAADYEFRFAELEKKSSSPHHSTAFDSLNGDDIEPLEELKKLSKAQSKVIDTTPRKEIKTDASKTPVQIEFDAAYEFFKTKDYKAARNAFENFINKNKKSALISNAHYYLGETYYINGEFDSAAKEFLKGYQFNTKGNKASDNLFKLAKSLSRLNKQKEACITYEKFDKEFPNALEEIKKQVTSVVIKCKG